MLTDRLISDLVLACMVMGVVSLVAFLYMARRRSAAEAPDTSLHSAGGLSSAELMVRRRRVFLHVYPEWENRDYESDPSSPWHTDLRFRTMHEAEAKAVRIVELDADAESASESYVLDDGFPGSHGTEKLAAGES